MKAIYSTILLMSIFFSSVVLTAQQGVGIGTTFPHYKLHVRSTSPGILKLDNYTALNTDVRTDLYFSTGDYYTGAIKTIGTGTAFARLGLFTYAGANTWDLQERLTILDDGNVGISDTTPSAPLSFASISGNKIDLFYNSASSRYGFGIQTGLMQIYTNGSSADVAFGHGSSAAFTEVMRIKGNGNVGIGTMTPLYRLDIKNTTSALLRLENSTTLGTNVNVDLYFKTGGVFSGAIKTIGQSASTARLSFFTGTNATATSLAERMSIVNSGDVGIGATVPLAKFHVSGVNDVVGRFHNGSTAEEVIGIIVTANVPGTGSRLGAYASAKDGPTSNIGLHGYAEGGNAAYGIYAQAIGGVTTNFAAYFSGNVYTTGLYQGSDRRLKHEIQPILNAIDLVHQLKPSAYKYKTDEYKQMNLPHETQYGLIADEVRQVMPGAVKKVIQPAQYENHDSANSKKLSDEVEFDAVNYVQMIPILIAAIQEQQTELEELRSLVNALKAGR